MNGQAWLNLLALVPGTGLTVLTIAIAFLRFYDAQDFSLLGLIAQPRLWSNRLTVAALVVALVNLGIEWDRRNQETDRLAEEEQRRTEDSARAAAEGAEERERAARRARVAARCRAALFRVQLVPSEVNRVALATVLAILDKYGETL